GKVEGGEVNTDRTNAPSRLGPGTQRSRRTLKPPPPHYMKAYQLSILRQGISQAELAKELEQELGLPVKQPQVSKWLKRAKEYHRSIMPELPEGDRKPTVTVDPKILERGRRQGHRKSKQSKPSDRD